jgi:hypothetical protein
MDYWNAKIRDSGQIPSALVQQPTKADFILGYASSNKLYRKQHEASNSGIGAS